MTTHTLRADGFDASEDGTGRGTPLVPVAFSCKDHGADASDIAPTLRSMGHDGSHANGGGQVAVAFAQNTRDEVREMPVVGALAAQPGMKQTSYIRQATAVRRLTPRECERLQGFPDDHTLIPWRGKPADECPDGPRYKALGNSMAVPVMAWIGRRIQLIDSLQ
jgi:DNA (cytosine-5)-methyltransferase 1